MDKTKDIKLSHKMNFTNRSAKNLLGSLNIAEKIESSKSDEVGDDKTVKK